MASEIPPLPEEVEKALGLLHENVERAAMDYSEAEHLDLGLFNVVRRAVAAALLRERALGVKEGWALTPARARWWIEELEAQAAAIEAGGAEK